MSDVIVTTPKSRIKEAVREAEDIRANEGGRYFRSLSSVPKIKAGERVWYVEDGFIRGYAIVIQVLIGQHSKTCDTTGREYAGACFVEMDAVSWRWIDPVPMRGFQGWRYFNAGEHKIREAGGWLDPRPVEGGTLIGL